MSIGLVKSCPSHLKAGDIHRDVCWVCMMTIVWLEVKTTLQPQTGADVRKVHMQWLMAFVWQSCVSSIVNMLKFNESFLVLLRFEN